MITNTTSTQDTVSCKAWLMGGIEEDGDNFFLKINNRSSIVDFGSVHQIENHSFGFTNESGEHTNKIEN
ncbi:hypothetical protein G9O61_00g015070 [Vairimorpha ceranae]|nr:hypothetical protein G9O61_00g015070 [Vairimorpha ceranae]